VPEDVEAALAPHDKAGVLRTCGYGVPNEDFAMTSGNRRVTLFAEGEITLDHFEIYAVPIPEQMIQAPGKKKIMVALAYDPPVRRRRADYLGVLMDPILIRGKTADEVREAFRKIQPDEDAEKAFKSPFKVDLEPSLNPREQPGRKYSTLQRAEFSFQRLSKPYGDTYWLVVRATRRRWVPLDVETQRYAVAVTLSADEPNLYALVRQRVMLRTRARGRA
jgi:hypothetical protein